MFECITWVCAILMHLICGYVSSRAVGENDAPSWYATGINELKYLLKTAPHTFKEDYSFIQEALTVAEKITSSKANDFKQSNWS